MTREEIIDTLRLYDTVSSAYNCDIVIEPSFDDIADTLLAKIEQEKKEQAREIICWFANETEKAFGKNYLAERIAKEYGVEL